MDGVEVRFHDLLHGFRVGRGTGNASLEVKLLQHLTSMRGEVIYEVFLDLRKYDDVLDREHFLVILIFYRIRPRMERILHIYWDILLMVA